jgi:hypothetical protein
MADIKLEGMCHPCKDAQTQDWYAWNDLQPPRPDYFHLTGEVCVPNPGVDVLLTPTIPQGVNHKILMLDLYLCQKPGVWPQVKVWMPARFDKKISEGYSEVNIMCSGNIIERVQVVDVH